MILVPPFVREGIQPWPDDIEDLPDDELAQLNRRLIQLLKPESLPVMSERLRARLSGQRTFALPLLLKWCAEGLRKLPPTAPLARQFTAEATLCEDLLERNLTLGGLIKTFELLQRGARDRMLCATRRATELRRTARDALLSYLGSHPQEAVLLRALFEPILRTEDQAARAADPPLRQELDEAEEDLAQQQMLDSFLTAAKARSSEGDKDVEVPV